ncbi:cytochrome P450 monooxygenase-like protein [Pseudovirgaria hyperparasitica]|uniref:Cytochrome P450 monooxygenase-like protein n=1 Tax=Pseudovirgaria hyperparasitica TaxID=470096 RepID=A0A6A6WJK6_9PEZI|nr:cytochrome P450 monooxygenase-like protein [Pseudovirgaria hyperparasitica]KAF2762464.1 cytochrome P450 monooxygenase-like protein [Pseudovirgaria hyperparasitica]
MLEVYQFSRILPLLSLVLLYIYYVTKLLYTALLGPLSRYPGPVSAKFSDIESYWHTVKLNRHIWLWQMHEKYGPIVRIGPNSVVISSVEGFHRIYDVKANTQKAEAYLAYAKTWGIYNTFTKLSKEEYQPYRRFVQSALSERNVKAAEPVVIENIDRWGDLLVIGGSSKTWSSPRDMVGEADALVFDIICDLCYGKSFNVKEHRENEMRETSRSIQQFMKINYMIAKSPCVKLWIWLKPRGLDALMREITPASIKRYFQTVERLVLTRLEEEELNEKKGIDVRRKDLLHFIFKARDEGKVIMSHGALVEEAGMFMIGGTDTTSHVTAALFFYLAHNPRVLWTLTQEIRSTFISLDDIKAGQALSRCKYLDACINEALRMSSSGNADHSREVLPGGLKVGDAFFPAGTIVGSSSYVLHHSADHFRDPFVFRPERWIVGGDITAADVARAETANFPFSLGPRGCPGKTLAWEELRLIFGRTLWRLDLVLAQGDTTGMGRDELGWGRTDKTQYQAGDAMVGYRKGPFVQFKVRE